MISTNGKPIRFNAERLWGRMVEQGKATPEDIEWRRAEVARQIAEEGAGLNADDIPDKDLPPLRALMDISAGVTDPRKTVLGHRFLCIGGGMLFVGPSGIGKSSASAQQDILWGLGREAFGIRPQRPLRILTIQSENDDEDLAEMRDGVVKGLRLTDEEKATVRANVFYDTEQTRTGPEFLAYVEERLKSCPCIDLLRLDPLLGCLGSDPTDTEKTAKFLRQGLNPLLTKYQVAAILNHHTPKTNNRDTSTWRGSDWMYAAAGGADITNWARAVMVIDPTHTAHVFKFIAAKRGSRIGWVNEEGDKEIIRHFCHASDGLYWRNATAEDLAAAKEAAAENSKPANKKDTLTVEKLLAMLPMNDPISQEALWKKIKDANYPEKRSRETIESALESRAIFKHTQARYKAAPAILFARFPQMKMVRPQ